MNFSQMSEKLSKGLTKELDFGEEKKEVITYAIETTLLSIIGTLMLLCLAYFLNALMPVVIAAIFGGSLRKLSGGAHFNTPIKCLVFGALTYSLIGVSAKKLSIHSIINHDVLLLVLLVSFSLVFLYAPVDSQAKPIHSKKLRVKLKVLSIGFVLISILLIFFFIKDPLINVSAVLGLLYQSITLLPIFNRKEVRNL